MTTKTELAGRAAKLRGDLEAHNFEDAIKLLDDYAAALTEAGAGEAEVERLREHIRRQAEDIMSLGRLVYAPGEPPVAWCDVALKDGIARNVAEAEADRLRAERDEFKASNALKGKAFAKASARVRALEGALEPFSHVPEYTDEWDDDAEVWLRNGASPLTKLTLADLRRARALLDKPGGE